MCSRSLATVVPIFGTISRDSAVFNPDAVVGLMADQHASVRSFEMLVRWVVLGVYSYNKYPCFFN